LIQQEDKLEAACTHINQQLRSYVEEILQ